MFGKAEKTEDEPLAVEHEIEHVESSIEEQPEQFIEETIVSDPQKVDEAIVESPSEETDVSALLAKIATSVTQDLIVPNEKVDVSKGKNFFLI